MTTGTTTPSDFNSERDILRTTGPGAWGVRSIGPGIFGRRRAALANQQGLLRRDIIEGSTSAATLGGRAGLQSGRAQVGDWEGGWLGNV